MTHQAKALPSAELLRQLFHYDPETGQLTRRFLHHEVAVSWRTGRYIGVGIGHEKYRAHRVIWKWMTGRDPVLDIDHINGEGTDNRWHNLREATTRQNLCNSKVQTRNASGIKGVTWDKKGQGRWIAGYTLNGKRVNLGRFLTIDEAHAAYLARFPLSN